MAERETKWTKGPWAVNPLNAQVDAFGEDGAVAVCALLWPTDRRSEAETEANAHLIATGPDLYRALKAVVAIADRKTVEFDAARAALSRARGETP